MFDYLQHMFQAEGLPPHGYCLLWDERLVWTHVVADLLTGFAYFSIPVALAVFLARRRDVEFGWVLWMFAAFILACGTTHFLSVLTLWVPAYGPEGLVKLATAAISVATAIALWPLIPKAVALPSPAQLQAANSALGVQIAERDSAFEALRREVEERARVEELLRQAQKMEAVGQLTGGIAHDFNNLLTAILANLDRAARVGGGDPRHGKALAAATEAAERAARLTGQLLAFARVQPVKTEVHELDSILVGMSELLQRTLGSRVRVDLAPGAPGVKVRLDPVQAENAILNLAINARDAMGDGGTVRLSTRTEDGQVVLEVMDTGVGMAPATLERAFEPFYTTKELGKGTGLGLSQVYGFATQTGGEVSLASKEGMGTTVTIRLPAISGVEAA